MPPTRHIPDKLRIHVVHKRLKVSRLLWRHIMRRIAGILQFARVDHHDFSFAHRIRSP